MIVILPALDCPRQLNWMEHKTHRPVTNHITNEVYVSAKTVFLGLLYQLSSSLVACSVARS